MRIWLLTVSIVALIIQPAFSETITLKNGRHIDGKVVGKTDEFITLDASGVNVTYMMDEITSIGETVITPVEKTEEPPQEITEPPIVEEIPVAQEMNEPVTPEENIIAEATGNEVVEATVTGTQDEQAEQDAQQPSLPLEADAAVTPEENIVTGTQQAENVPEPAAVEQTDTAAVTDKDTVTGTVSDEAVDTTTTGTEQAQDAPEPSSEPEPITEPPAEEEPAAAPEDDTNALEPNIIEEIPDVLKFEATETPETEEFSIENDTPSPQE